MKSILPAASGATRPRVLIVDDEEIILVALLETLRREHYDVVTTPDPDAALAELERGEFSVIISDHCMPAMMGLELLARARQVQPMATRILITAVLSLDTVIEAINKGEIYRFIVKPWLREDLLMTLRNAVQRHELLKQNARLDSETRLQNEALRDENRILEDQWLASMRLSAGLLREKISGQQGAGDYIARLESTCRKVAQAAGLSPQEARTLVAAGFFLDVGRTVGGQQRIGAEPALKEVPALIRASGERWNGTGPDGLVGEQIPWLARLLAVIVACVERGSAPEALAEIKSRSGTEFDPEAVQVLTQAMT